MSSNGVFKIGVIAAVLGLVVGSGSQAGADEPASLGWFRAAVDRGLADVGRLAKAEAACDDASDPAVENGVARRSAVLDRMTGFAKQAGTTGGLGRKVFVVTTLQDARERGGTGPAGSLREALFLARREGGGWISFSGDLADRRIDLVFALFVPSNVTIDGGCRGMAISTPGTSVLVVKDVENVVITRLRIEQRAPFNKGRGDCVSGSGSDRLWVAFNTIRRCEDGLLDFGVTSYSPDKPARATIAFNHFKDHEKDILLATYDCAGERAGGLGCDRRLQAPWTWNGGVQATLEGNVFDATSQRHPRLAGHAYAHMVDNVVGFAPVEREPGTFGATYGSYAGAGSRLFAQNNLYVALDVGRSNARRKAIRAEPGQSATRLEGNVLLGEADMDESGADLVPPPPYDLGPSYSWKDPAAVIACAAARVGPEGFAARTSCR